MSEEPTVEQMRRYLQEQLIEADNIVGKKAKAERIWLLEAALQEAINFMSEVEIRKELESIIFEESSAVRLLSKSTDIDSDDSKLNSGECPKCEEPLDDELSFCLVCGYKK